MMLWEEATQAGRYRRRPLPRSRPPSWHDENRIKNERERETLAHIKQTLMEANRDAFTRGAGLARPLLKAIRQERKAFNAASFIFSQVPISVPARYDDAVRAVCLYGAIIGLKEVNVWKLPYEDRSLLRTKTIGLLTLIQQLLTRAWMRLSLHERLLVLDDWYRGQPYRYLVREEWNNTCIGAARVATTGMALPQIYGNWKGYFGSIVHDMDGLDVVFTGRGHLDEKEWTHLGFLIQVKGGKIDDIHVVERRGLPPPKTVDQETWRRLQLLWDKAKDVYNRMYEFVPVLITVGGNSRFSPHNIEDRAPELAAAIQEKFR